MKHSFEDKIYYSDTDCYGVVWHGAYTRWVERSRTEFCNVFMDVHSLEKAGTLFPVVELNIRYKASAKLFDQIIVETTLIELKKTSMKFETKVIDKTTGKIFVIATSTLVTTSLNGKLNRQIPDEIYQKLEQIKYETVSAR
ncbi:MAG: thioesterase family protein [Candidatus Gastranaerophilales bacterium]|nr:thioesterase family protein [Candidatus Gastranaerophilales bacterium]